MSCSRIRQMRIQRPLGFIFQKSVEEGGGCLLCGGEVCWPAPPPCLVTSNCSAAIVSILRNVMVWPPSQGVESAHVRTKKVFRFVYTRLIWTYLFVHVFCLHMFEHICLLMISCICLWTYLFAHAKSGSETVQLSSYEDADHNVKGWWTWPPLMANNWCLPS